MTTLALVLLHKKRECECSEDEKEECECETKYHFRQTIMNECRNAIENCGEQPRIPGKTRAPSPVLPYYSRLKCLGKTIKLA